jgi:RNA polymerase sigma-70 factor (ECF subfamily)
VSDAVQTDDALLAAARIGERAAIEVLLERYQGRVFRFGLHMCGDTEDARDILQETLLAAARALGEFRGDSSISTWLYTIARSFCLKKRRLSKFAPVEQISLDRAAGGLVSPAPGPEELAARDETKQALVEALEALDAPLREVMILRDIEGLTAPEVAEITGASVDAIKSRLHRARAAVRERLGAVLGEKEEPPSVGCPDVLTSFSKQIEGDLDPGLCAELQHHVEGCAACRARCHSLKRTLAVCAGGPPGPVPPAVKESVRAALRTELARRL